MSRLEEMLRIAQAATKGKWTWGSRWICQKRGDGDYAYLAAVPPGEEDGDRWNKDAQHIATFNPRTAEALVKRQIALLAFAEHMRERFQAYRDHQGTEGAYPLPASVALLDVALTAAMEDNSNG